MPLQPALGARDLNPQQVEVNQLLTSKLSNVYTLWGYEEVAPPKIERLETLMAGGAINNQDILKVVADEPLGLRPEMTTSVTRVASARFAEKPRPLRLWTSGTVFKCKEAIEGGIHIEETSQSGIELFGIAEIDAEMELMSILINGFNILKISKSTKPILLLGHAGLMELILSGFRQEYRNSVRKILSNLDMIKMKKLDINPAEKQLLEDIIYTRGNPSKVLTNLKNIFGENIIIQDLQRLFSTIKLLSERNNINIQLDPTFSPHYQLYNGLLFQLVCFTESCPVVIARGGRYDEIVRRFSKNKNNSYGVGFSFAIDKIRELLNDRTLTNKNRSKTLVAFGGSKKLEDALEKQKFLHDQGKVAIVEFKHCQTIDQAYNLQKLRRCDNLLWVN